MLQRLETWVGIAQEFDDSGALRRMLRGHYETYHSVWDTAYVLYSHLYVAKRRRHITQDDFKVYFDRMKIPVSILRKWDQALDPVEP